MKVNGTPDMQALLAQMRALASEARAVPGTGWGRPTPGTDFSQVLSQSIAAVNGLQQRASGLAESFERGDPQVSLAEVAIAREKAGLAFQATLQVRNKLIAAYQDIMNMPI